MKKATCIAIDDEPLALLVITQFCERFGGLELTTFSEPLVGLEEIRRCKPDLVFLDIEMNSISGLDIARDLPEECCFIFTTAHAQYALNGFELDAVDFLHKPFAYERFCQALDSFCRRREAMRSGGKLDQSALDSLLHDTIPTALPKGLQPPTLERILDCLRKAGKPLTGEAIAAAAAEMAA